MTKKPGGAETVAQSSGVARGVRSPNFPSISLSEALAKARVLYDKDKRAASSLQTVLEHLGFGKKLSGNAGRVISALRQFGLLEESNGQYRVTEAAMRIFTLSDAAPERIEAIQESARKPAIYREVLSHYEDGLPSDANLRDFLILKKKFNPDSVDTFIRVLKSTLEFANLDPAMFSEPDDAPARAIGNPSLKPPPVGSAREVSSLQEGEAVLQWPSTLSADSVQELEDWLALVIKKLKRRYAEGAK